MQTPPKVIPVVIVTQFIEPPKPKVALTPPAPVTPPSPVAAKAKQSAAQAFNPTPTKAPPPALPLPAATMDPTPALNGPASTTAPQGAPATIAASQGPAASGTTVGAAPSAPAVQLPSSDADYLQNPRPPYPSISRRLNEQGRTTVRVQIGVDGLPQRAEIVKSSGYSRLDDAALNTVMGWRFMPGKRGGVPEAMWFNVPIHWVLE